MQKVDGIVIMCLFLLYQRDIFPCSSHMLSLYILMVCLCVSQECEAAGEDYNRVKLLEIGADEAERWEKKKKKKNPDTGFAGQI